eukprot:COSAG02_NODE_43232_length_376_cov_29115.346570_1_plen_43_part_10
MTGTLDERTATPSWRRWAAADVMGLRTRADGAIVLAYHQGGGD